jgi:hypothetical protein
LFCETSLSENLTCPHLPVAFFKKKIGISVKPFNLTPVLVVKTIVSLFLGLVLQLSQAGACMAAKQEKSCVPSAPAMSCCCEGLPSCPCAKESRENEKPAPQLPASVELKLLLSKAPESPQHVTLLSPPSISQSVVAFPALDRCAYQGVPLAVAFCMFVI